MDMAFISLFYYLFMGGTIVYLFMGGLVFLGFVFFIILLISNFIGITENKNLN